MADSVKQEGGSVMRGQAVRLGCGVTLTGVGAFVVWFCCSIANLKMGQTDAGTYLKHVVDTATAIPDLALALLLGMAAFVAGCVLAVGALLPRRTKRPSCP